MLLGVIQSGHSSCSLTVEFTPSLYRLAFDVILQGMSSLFLVSRGHLGSNLVSN
jgi:hypothetical protein